jgi:pimeloyl-ACP methyl ester carboxylesterase
MSFIRVNGLNLYYELHGDGEPLVLISGFSTDHHTWDPIINKLASQFKLLIFDNRSVGQTEDSSTPFSINDMASDVKGLMDALGISSAHILGHSMGSSIAQAFAINYPQRIKTLILANGFIKINPITQFVLAGLERMLFANVQMKIVIDMLIPWYFGSDSMEHLNTRPWLKEQINFLYHNPHPQSLLGFQQQFNALCAYDPTNDLSKIAHSTMVIAGDGDLLIPMKETEDLATTIKNAEFKIIPDCGHLPHIERPDLFIESVSGFIRRCS